MEAPLHEKPSEEPIDSKAETFGEIPVKKLKTEAAVNTYHNVCIVQAQPYLFNLKSLSENKALKFVVHKTYQKARASTLTLPHGDVLTPVYMPVGTKGTIKGLTSEEMDQLGCKLLLGNTYHLAYQPGGDFLEKVGGLHKFMNWKHNILTDSGGFQMVSLSKLCEITEEGVRFSSPVDGSEMFLPPEQSMKEQNQIGADIMMALDDVVQTTTVGDRMKIACERTVRWIDRNIAAHSRKQDQNLYPIVQGGIDTELRKYCLEELIKRDAAGYAIGGLAGGEDKQDFWRVVHQCTDSLPADKPRYLMGVGYPEDLIVCSSLGVDQFDCVFSTRTARFGTAFTKYGFMKIKNKDKEFDLKPIEEDCECPTCQRYSRAYLHQTIAKEETACHLISQHNLHFLLTLMKRFRQAILDECLEEFVNTFFRNYYRDEKVIPQWIKDAMVAAKINLNITFE